MRRLDNIERRMAPAPLGEVPRPSRLAAAGSSGASQCLGPPRAIGAEASQSDASSVRWCRAGTAVPRICRWPRPTAGSRHFARRRHMELPRGVLSDTRIRCRSDLGSRSRAKLLFFGPYQLRESDADGGFLAPTPGPEVVAEDLWEREREAELLDPPARVKTAPLLPHFATLIAFQIGAELFVRHFQLRLPGPLVGMVAVLVFLFVRRNAPDGLKQVAKTVIDNLNLFFLPAGTAVVTATSLISSDVQAIVIAVVFSTLISLAITAAIATTITRLKGGSGSDKASDYRSDERRSASLYRLAEPHSADAPERPWT